LVLFRGAKTRGDAGSSSDREGTPKTKGDRRNNHRKKARASGREKLRGTKKTNWDGASKKGGIGKKRKTIWAKYKIQKVGNKLPGFWRGKEEGPRGDRCRKIGGKGTN